MPKKRLFFEVVKNTLYEHRTKFIIVSEKVETRFLLLMSNNREITLKIAYKI